MNKNELSMPVLCSGTSCGDVKSNAEMNADNFFFDISLIMKNNFAYDFTIRLFLYTQLYSLWRTWTDANGTEQSVTRYSVPQLT